jgi:hypothetical protein
MAGIKLEEVMAKLADDVSVPLGEDGSIKGSDLKSYLSTSQSELSARDKRILAQEAEINRLRKIESDQAALFEAAARGVQNDPPLNPADRRQAPLSDDDQEYQALVNDPLYAPFAKKVIPRLLKDWETSLDGRLKPEFDELKNQNRYLTRALLNQQTESNYRTAGEWPEGWDLRKVHEYATQRKYFVPGGEQWGMIDVARVHNEVMTPIQREKEIQTIRAQAKEEALREFRSAPNVFQMPNREMGGGKKAPKAKGRTPDEIFGNAMNEAAQDLDTQRALAGIGNKG